MGMGESIEQEDGPARRGGVSRMDNPSAGLEACLDDADVWDCCGRDGRGGLRFRSGNGMGESEVVDHC